MAKDPFANYVNPKMIDSHCKWVRVKKKKKKILGVKVPLCVSATNPLLPCGPQWPIRLLHIKNE